MIEFDWLIHYTCNYRCPYCFFEGMWPEVERRNKYLPNDAWVGAWKRLHARYGDIKIIITGGEVFAYPRFVQLAAELNRFATLSFDTNFSCGESELLALADAVNPRTVFMGLSFHPRFAKIDEFLKKAGMLAARGFDFRIHYVTYPEQLGKLKEYRDIFRGAGYRFTPIPFRGTYGGKPYPQSFTPDERECIYEVTDGGAAIDRDWANNQVVQVKSRNTLCRAGQWYARVDSDGSVYPCGNDYTKSRDKYLLGNILDENFTLRDEPMLCRQETCPCEFRWIVGGQHNGESEQK
jgi:MoaA/NifB/PqqE/SkfB family radical SAM enzyme